MVTLLVLGALVFVGCGKKAAKAPTAAPAAGGAAATTAPAAPAAGGAAATTAPAAAVTGQIELGPKGEELLYNKKELGPVAAGSEVTLKFDNSSMVNQHNFILLNADDEALAAKTDAAGATAGLEKGYLPADLTNVVAHAKFLQPGQNDTLIFKAPATPGTYIYMCTVPGHYAAGMKGKLVVQ